MSWRTPAPTFEAAIQRCAQIQARRVLAARLAARTSLRAFCEALQPDIDFAYWQLDLIDHIEWALATPDARLMVFAPPRHGKSLVVSRLLPAYLLGRDPKHEVLCAAGTQNLADEFGLFVRNLLNTPVYQEICPQAKIDKNSNAVSKLTMAAGGGYRSVGCGVQIVGRGAGTLIIDDPYPSRTEAYSATTRAGLSGWYRTEARTRLAPQGRIILMHQRWHPEDLAAELLAQAAKDPEADQWRVLIYPAIAEAGYADAFERCREPGMELDPRRWHMKALRALRSGMPEDEWLALYQQRPVNAEGGFFKADWFQYHSGLPDKLNWFIGVDFAATADTRNDRCAFVPVGVNSKGDWYIPSDYVFEHLESPDAVERLLDLVAKYKPVFVATEKGVLDRVMRPILRVAMSKRQTFVSFREVSRTSGKHIMAAPLQARLQARTLYFPQDRRTKEQVVPQFLDFIPEADNKVDDMIDALANLAQVIPVVAGPEPELPPLPKDPQKEEDERWERIMAGQRRESPVPFARFNGKPY